MNEQYVLVDHSDDTVKSEDRAWISIKNGKRLPDDLELFTSYERDNPEETLRHYQDEGKSMEFILVGDFVDGLVDSYEYVLYDPKCSEVWCDDHGGGIWQSFAFVLDDKDNEMEPFKYSWKSVSNDFNQKVIKDNPALEYRCYPDLLREFSKATLVDSQMVNNKDYGTW